MDRKQFRDLFRALDAQGFTYRRTGTGHWQVRNPDGRVVTVMASTPSDHRSMRNSLADLRRAGFNWKRK